MYKASRAMGVHFKIGATVPYIVPQSTPSSQRLKKSLCVLCELCGLSYAFIWLFPRTEMHPSDCVFIVLSI